MFRRQFLRLIPLASAAALAPIETISAAIMKTVHYRVKGFSCATCAVGLDTMLRQQRGVESSMSTYPDGKMVISFNPDVIGEDRIRAFITDMGFTVESDRKL